MQGMSQAPLAAQIGPETAPLGHFVAFGVLWPPSCVFVAVCGGLWRFVAVCGVFWRLCGGLWPHIGGDSFDAFWAPKFPGCVQKAPQNTPSSITFLVWGSKLGGPGRAPKLKITGPTWRFVAVLWRFGGGLRGGLWRFVAVCGCVKHQSSALSDGTRMPKDPEGHEMSQGCSFRADLGGQRSLRHSLHLHSG